MKFHAHSAQRTDRHEDSLVHQRLIIRRLIELQPEHFRRDWGAAVPGAIAPTPATVIPFPFTRPTHLIGA